MKARRFLSKLIALVGILVVVSAALPTAVRAQGRVYRDPRLNAIRRPTVSPYLELLNRDRQFGLPTYQSRVRPEIEQRRVNRQQQGQIQRLQRDAARQGKALRAGTGELRTTGHRSFFMNYSHYFSGLRTQ